MNESKFYERRIRSGKANEHHGWIPQDFWLQDWEKEKIIDFFHAHPREGCRRLTFMMLDAAVVAVPPSSVWRVLSKAGLLRSRRGMSSTTTRCGCKVRSGLSRRRTNSKGETGRSLPSGTANSRRPGRSAGNAGTTLTRQFRGW